MSKHSMLRWLELIFNPSRRRFDQIIELIHRNHRIMAQELDTLKAQTLAVKTAVDSAVLLLQDLSARLTNAISPAEVALVASDLSAAAQALSAAVTAATPPTV